MVYHLRWSRLTRLYWHLFRFALLSCWRPLFCLCKSLFFSLSGLWGIWLLVDLSVCFYVCRLHYHKFDLVLAAMETVVTFNVAYCASVVLGTVLLQTSPERGLSGGRMEAFLRAMKEVGFCDFLIFGSLFTIVSMSLRSNATLKSSIYLYRTSGN